MNPEYVAQNTVGNSYEQQLGREMFGRERARSSIDKALATEDVAELKRLISKDNMTKEDFSNLIYHLTSTELKLIKLDGHTQYILLKFFVWVREYVRVAQKFYDVETKLKGNLNNLFSKEDISGTPQEEVSPIGLDLFDQAKRGVILDAKFMIDVFLGMARSTLSMDAVGFQKTLTESHEIEYGLKPIQEAKK